MKKTIIAAITGGIIALGALCCIASSHISKDMLEANVEALADGEFDYPTGYPYFTTCQVVVSTFLSIPVRCGNTIVICQGGGSGCNSVQCPIHPNSSI